MTTPDERCPKRSPMPCGNGTICCVTYNVLPAGPCPKNCEHRPVEADT